MFQLINAIGQRVEIEVTSNCQSLRALPKCARDVRNGLEKIGDSPQRANLPLTGLGTEAVRSGGRTGGELFIGLNESAEGRRV